MSTPQPPYPLDPSVEHLLEPQYVEFYNKYIINQQVVHHQPVEASRSSGVLIPGASDALEVAKIEDYTLTRTETKGESFKVRVFTPTSPKPEAGYPIFLYFHGGGWVLGNINTENVHCTNWAQRAECVCVSVDYRLAPEHPYPAAVEDAWESYLWLANGGASLIGGDLTKLAAGGSSAGGNLTAILTHMITERQSSTPSLPSICFQLLVVPVTDNTADGDIYWTYDKFQNTAALPREKMLWYRYKYLPDEKTWSEPRASPLYYPERSFKSCPPAYVAVAELDVLRAEGEFYAAKLQRSGVPVKVKVYKGVPHVVMAMDGVLDRGKELVSDCCEELYKAFH
ncbi:unnamed protein product [Kuraishia capsulata CBS 1993]|uniref:Alpha/beta hydrolase fold-3 domain-containing protein n=1 Tax=Kuraishia capsulata CBS 1993 TaxID=1382522 RepID=W6MJ62_9ASCO|nr:uncharacterized protein KUCA_T00002501001 [Kuraishia capsulata CBS 1993]CDK26529.1 unnamed protein product [Kuraishia capsulata CBS 1993]